MTGQSNEAAERSAHTAPASDTLPSVFHQNPDGSVRLAAVVKLEKEVARLREALRELTDAVAARQDDPSMVAGMRLGAAWHAARAALAATDAQDDRSSPEDRERWLAEWMRTQREGGG